jgi:hypothetical protein
VSNWTTSIGTISRALTDVERCPYSGSLAATADSQQVITQCVRNTPLVGDFNFGARHNFGTGGIVCQAVFYSGFNCDADEIAANETDTVTPMPNWSLVSGVILGVKGANSVAFNCYLFQSPGDTHNLDMFYLSKVPSAF